MLGIHSGKSSKITGRERDTLIEAIKQDCSELKLGSVQIFTHGPRTNKENNIDKNEIKLYIESKKIKLYIHSPYVSATLWMLSRYTRNDGKVKTALHFFRKQLEAAKKCGASGVVLHLPKKPIADVKETLRTPIFKDIILRCGVPILFEIVPAKDQVNGFLTPEQLKVFCLIAKKYIPTEYWGLCIDTAHLWGGGVDTTSKKAQDEWFEDLEDDINMIKLFHLNGSEKKMFNTGQDQHTIAFSSGDDMYSKYNTGSIAVLKTSGVSSIVNFCVKNSVPIICEIGKGTEAERLESLQLINKLA